MSIPFFHGRLVELMAKKIAEIRDLRSQLISAIYDLEETRRQASDSKEIISHEYDEEYLSSLINKAKGAWQNIDPDEWLRVLRGHN